MARIFFSMYFLKFVIVSHGSLLSFFRGKNGNLQIFEQTSVHIPGVLCSSCDPPKYMCFCLQIGWSIDAANESHNYEIRTINYSLLFYRTA